jgi:polysaccharide pyruvyl transferase WcaK-like protein
MLAGHVEIYDQAMIGGWAVDDERPGEPQFVDILFDGRLYARIAASLPRRDRGACGFKLVLPREIGIGRERTLVEVRFGSTGALLGNSPRHLSFHGAAKRVLVMVPAGLRYGHDKVKARPAPLRDHIETYYNTGDWMVFDSSLKLLSFAELEPVNLWAATDAEIARFNAEFDYAFLRGSNYIYEAMDWGAADEVLAKLKIPVISFGVGAQAPRASRLRLPEKAIRVWKQFADHAATIGVRGRFSAEVLNDHGIRNVEVIGCPSLFRHKDPTLQIGAKPFEQLRRLAFSLRREVSAGYADDQRRYLSVQKKVIKHLAEEFDLTLTAHGEPAEKAFFYKDAELMEKHRSLLFKEGWFDPSDEGLMAIYQDRLFYHDRVEDFDSFIRSQDLALGFRVHANLPALANGVPALFVGYDSRSQELAETFRVPCVTLDDVDRQSLSEIYAPSLWYAFNRHYPGAYRKMAAFLDRNGITHRM